MDSFMINMILCILWMVTGVLAVVYALLGSVGKIVDSFFFNIPKPKTVDNTGKLAAIFSLLFLGFSVTLYLINHGS